MIRTNESYHTRAGGGGAKNFRARFATVRLVDRIAVPGGSGEVRRMSKRPVEQFLPVPARNADAGTGG